MPSPGQPVQLVVLPSTDGPVRLELRGELDHAAIDTVRAALREQYHATSQPITLDVRQVGYISSAGVALLVETVNLAAGRLRLVADSDSAPGRVLSLTGPDVPGLIADPEGAGEHALPWPS